MSDPIENQEQQAPEAAAEQAPAPGMEDFHALQKEVEALKAHSQKLLDEKKKEQAKRREAEIIAQQEAQEAAKKKGDFEQLFKSSEAERERLQSQLSEFQQNIVKEKIHNKAMELAQQAASGYRAQDLAEHISRRIDFSEGEFRVKNDSGELTIDSPNKLLEQMKSQERFQHLFDGPKSTGGGATGNDSSAAKANVKTRSEFDKMDPVSKSAFMRKGGTLIDD